MMNVIRHRHKQVYSFLDPHEIDGGEVGLQEMLSSRANKVYGVCSGPEQDAQMHRNCSFAYPPLTHTCFNVV